MIPLDELSRSHFGIYEIPGSSPEICNIKSTRFTLVQAAPKHFVPPWDEVDFLKTAASSCGQLVHKQKNQAFNFHANYVEVIFIFLFSILLTLRQVGTKLPIASKDEVHPTFYIDFHLWATRPQDFPTNCREVDCHTLKK